jgi:hypothetical protein
MGPVLKAMLEGVIDYAGVYPPAELSTLQAIRKYREISEGDESWILNRFMCPADKLRELDSLLNQEKGGAELPVAVTGPGGNRLEDFRRGLEDAADLMTEFQSRVGDRAAIEAFETRLPNDRPHEALPLLSAIEGIDVFVEVPCGAEGRELLAAIAEREEFGAKARTGGGSADHVPSSEDLAAFLREALDLEIKFKLTAGLHHPLRHWSAALDTWEHGYLNVLIAACLHDEHSLSLSETIELIEERDPSALELNDDAVSWSGISVGREQIELTRELFAGFGSCSVEEPLKGLRALGLLEGVVA